MKFRKARCFLITGLFCIFVHLNQFILNNKSLHILSVTWCLILLGLIGSTDAFAGEVTPSDCSSCADCDGEATVTADHPGMLIYRWLNNNGEEIFQETNDEGFSTIDGLCPGIYYVSVAQSENTLSNHSFNIAVDGFDPGDNSTYFTCANSSSFELTEVLEGEPMAGGVWTDDSGTFQPTVFNPTTVGDETLYYSIDAGDCDVVSELVVVTNEAAYAGNSTTYDICDDYEPFELFDVLNQNPDPNGTWLDTENNEIDGVFTPGEDPEGTYTYMIDTVPGCQPVYSFIHMDVHELPNPGQDTTLIICSEADQVILSDYLEGNPDSGGQWKDPSNQEVDSLLVPAEDPEGQYRYVVSGTTPCPTQYATVDVIYDTLITAGSDTEILLCESDSEFTLISALEGTPDTGGLWTDDLGNQVEGTFNPQEDEPATYQYAVQAIGCEAETATLSIEIELQPTAGADSSLTLCESEADLTLSNYLSYEANTGGEWWMGEEQLENDEFDAEAGTYFFEYRVAGEACPADTSSIEIQSDPAVIAVEDQDWVFCEDEPAVFLNEMDEFEELDVAFFNAESDEEVLEFDPGTGINTELFGVFYSVNTCPNDTSNFSIQVDSKAFEDSVASFSFCENDELLNLDDLLAEAWIGTGNWFAPDGTTSVTDFDLVPGDFEFQYTVDNGVACESSVLSVNVHVSDQHFAGEDSLVSFCASDPELELQSLQSQDAHDGGTWWIDGEEQDGNYTVDPAQLDGLTAVYEVQSEAPCPASVAEFQFNVDEEVVFDIQDELSFCANDNSQPLIQDNPNDYSIEWTPSPVLISAGGAGPMLVFDQIPNELYSEMLNVQISNGACHHNDSIFVEVFPYPEVALGNDLSLCEGEAYTITATGAESYSWNGSGIVENSDSASVSGVAETDISYTVIGHNSYGCSQSSEIYISVLDTPEVVLDIFAESGCSPVNATLEFESVGTPVSSHYWTVNNDFLSLGGNSTITLEDAGDYNVELHVTGQNGCPASISSSDTISVYPFPEAGFLMDPTSVSDLRPEVNLLNTTAGATIYSWQLEGFDFSTDENPTLNFSDEEPGRYDICLSAENDHGCSDSTCKTIEVEGLFSIYVPNAFTPDSDGINEVFKPVMEGIDPTEYKMVIYDRWGKLVFETNDPNKGWIGNYQGGNHYVPPGVYNWQLKVMNKFSREIEMHSGHITLLR